MANTITEEDLVKLIHGSKWQASYNMYPADEWVWDDREDKGSQYKTAAEHRKDGDREVSYTAEKTSTLEHKGSKITITHHGMCNFVSSHPMQTAEFWVQEGLSDSFYDYKAWIMDLGELELVDSDGEEISERDFLKEYSRDFPDFFQMSEHDDYEALLPAAKESDPTRVFMSEIVEKFEDDDMTRVRDGYTVTIDLNEDGERKTLSGTAWSEHVIEHGPSENKVLLRSQRSFSLDLQDPDSEIAWAQESVWMIDSGVLSLYDDEGLDFDPADYGESFAQFDALIDEEKIEELVEFERDRYTANSKLGM